MADIKQWQETVHALEKEKGWLDGEYNIPEKLALIHSEISEALEAYRDGDMGLFFDGPKPDGFGVELADAVIRILGMAETLGIDLEALMLLKHNFNKTRPRRHGGKVC